MLHYTEDARRMRIIDNEHPVAVVAIRPHLEEEARQAAQKAVDQLRRGLPTSATYRALQEHMASIPERELELAINVGHAIEIAGDLHQWGWPLPPSTRH
ncbi:hypothetical protein [Streptomyces sp. NPDC048410]|uniref:hypothetical protein n=1 Tax=Streptomyces sp. NPDC048410 TaxID=3365545 RepID=UPI00371073C7